MNLLLVKIKILGCCPNPQAFEKSLTKKFNKKTKIIVTYHPEMQIKKQVFFVGNTQSRIIQSFEGCKKLAQLLGAAHFGFSTQP